MSEKMLVTQALDERDLLVKKIGDKTQKINGELSTFKTMNGNGSADNDDAGMATCRNPWAWSGDKAVGPGLPTWLYGRQFISVFRNHASLGFGEAMVKYRIPKESIHIFVEMLMN